MNIEDLRRYSRQQRQDITSRLKTSGRESADQAFIRTARGLRTLLNDDSALECGPKVVAARDINITQEEADRRWRAQLPIEAQRRAENYAATAYAYLAQKAEAEHKENAERKCAGSGVCQ
ncbi:TPA: hypothetical protein ACRI53_004282 [Klebsiella michiganensis]